MNGYSFISEIYSEEFLEKNWKEWFLAIQGFFYFTQGVAMVAILLLPIYMQEIFFEPLYYQDKAIELSLYYAGIIMIPWSAKLIFGLLSDNVGFGKFGRRKPYFVFAGIFGIIGWVCLPLFGSFNWLFIIVGY